MQSHSLGVLWFEVRRLFFCIKSMLETNDDENCYDFVKEKP